jgi:hypothetical protein
MPLGIGSILGRAEEKRLNAELKQKLGDALKVHRLFDGVWTKEILGRGAMARVWAGMWSCLGGKFGEFTNWGKIDEWVDSVVLKEVSSVIAIEGS